MKKIITPYHPLSYFYLQNNPAKRRALKLT